MSDKDYSQLTSATSASDSDLLAIYPTGGPLKKFQFSVFLTQVIAAMNGVILKASNNLSDLASAAAARANLGLGSAATQASSALFQVANNLSEVANANSARDNLGACAKNAPMITGGMDFTGSTKQNVQGVAGTAFDLSLTDFFTKSISADTTFTFTNPTASKAQGFSIRLTKSGGANDTWPASVKWTGGVKPLIGDGTHVVGFLTFDGGTEWIGLLLATGLA